MNTNDCITHAMQHALDLDTPEALLPLTINQDACRLAGLESDTIGNAGWLQ